MFTSALKKLLIVPPILLAVFVVWTAQNRQSAVAQEPTETPIPVRVATVAPVVLTGQASGFGRVQATRTWSGISEVQGRLVEYADRLQPGSLVQAGQLLFRIDPRDYEIALSQGQADVQRAEADLEAIAVNAQNSEQSLTIEREILKIYEGDRDRAAGLVAAGSVPATQLEDANRTLFSQQSVVASLEASLALVASDTLSAEAALAKAKADLEAAARDLERTRVVAPFDGRITSRGASLGQFVRVGDALLSMETTDASEVTAAFQPADLARLFGSLIAPEMLAQASTLPPETRFEQIIGANLTARVVAQYGEGLTASWPARVTRLTGNIEADTGTIGMVVQVDDAGRPDPETQRPGLVNGGFVEVVLTGPALDNQIAIPLSAVRYDGAIPYVLLSDNEDRLARRNVTLGPEFDGLVSISEGLEIGSKVILSDPRPAALGLLLEPLESEIPE